MIDRTYYHRMAQRNRLIPLRFKGKLKGLVTFYIANGNIEKFINRDPWHIVDDSPDGETVYIDQCVTNHAISPLMSLSIYHNVIDYIKSEFPAVKYVRWNRWKNDKLNQYKRRIR